MPGVLIVEAMAQAGGVLAMTALGDNAAGKVVYFMALDKVKFRKPGRARRPAAAGSEAAAQGRRRLEDEGRRAGRRTGRGRSRISSDHQVSRAASLLLAFLVAGCPERRKPIALKGDMGPAVVVVEPNPRRPQTLLAQVPLADEKEPDDDLAHAQPLEAQKGIKGTLAAAHLVKGKPASDEDFYSWTEGGTPGVDGGAGFHEARASRWAAIAGRRLDPGGAGRRRQAPHGRQRRRRGRGRADPQPRGRAGPHLLCARARGRSATGGGDGAVSAGGAVGRRAAGRRARAQR